MGLFPRRPYRVAVVDADEPRSQFEPPPVQVTLVDEDGAPAGGTSLAPEQSAQVAWAPAALSPASNTLVPLHVAGTASTNNPVAALSRETDVLDAVQGKFDGTEFSWEVLKDGVFSFDVDVSGLVGNATDGNVQVFFTFSDQTAPSLFGNTSPGSGKQPIVGTGSAGLAMSYSKEVFVPAGTTVTPKVRFQYSGSPSTPPSITSVTAKVTMTANGLPSVETPTADMRPVDPGARAPYFQYDGGLAIDSNNGSVVPTSHSDDWSAGTWDITPEGILTFEHDIMLTQMSLDIDWDVANNNDSVEIQVLYAGSAADWYRLAQTASWSPAPGETNFSTDEAALSKVHALRAGDKLRVFVYGPNGSHIDGCTWQFQVLLEGSADPG